MITKKLLFIFFFLLMPKAIVIGAGFGGLATAIILAKKGYQVTLIEKNDKAGGRANLLEKNGYKWDMGPSWYLMPDIFEKFFKSIGKDIKDYLKLKKLDPSYRVYFKDEKIGNSKKNFMDIFSDLKKVEKQFDSIEPGSGKKLKEYLNLAKKQYPIAMNNFVFKSYKNLREALKPSLLFKALKLNIFSTLYTYVSRFIKNENLKKILLYPTVFLGTSPYDASAAYNIMSHLDFNEGVFYPQGGIFEISKALEKLALEYGVKFIFKTPVEKILVEDGKVIGVQAKNKIWKADIVISNADMHHTETQLLELKHQSYPESYRSKKVMSPAGFIIYLGVDGKIPQLTHHTLVFTHDRKAGFDQIFKNPERSKTPNYYIGTPSKTDPSVAPKGKENLFVFVPIAPGLSAKKDFLEKYADRILDNVQSDCNIPNFKERIEERQIFSINEFKSYYNAYKGTALGLAHTLFQSAVLRPQNTSKKVKGLYYVGGYTTPGIGMPMCLLSGQLVAERILKK